MLTGYGAKIKTLRGKESRAELAEAIGVSESAVAMYENEERMPRDKTKMAIAKHFDTTVQAIFFEN